MTTTPATGTAPRLGLAANAAPFTLLVVNALVGGVLGSERTVLPLLADREFHLAAYTAALTYILAFGATKAATNFFAGTLSDRYGRKPVLLAGWLIALPIPAILIWAPHWGWVVAANVLLGINQGLAWSTTVIMKIDLAGPARRGLAMGLNEAAGYIAVAATAMATGTLAATYGLRPAPFLLAAAYIALGLGLSLIFVRETREHARHEATTHTSTHDGKLSTRQVFALASWREPALSSASQAGMVNNLNDGLAWGLFPILFATAGLSLTQIGALAALYPAVWGLGQLVTGPASDRYGRKPFIVTGMLTQAAALALIATADGFTAWAAAAVLPARAPPRCTDAARHDLRRRPPGLAGPRRRRLPALARRRVRRRRPARRHHRRPRRPPRRRLGHRRTHRRIRAAGLDTDVRDPPARLTPHPSRTTRRGPVHPHRTRAPIGPSTTLRSANTAAYEYRICTGLRLAACGLPDVYPTAPAPGSYWAVRVPYF
ncbi:MFS transporter [Actinoplanes oblitus]|uniref:MFS transporter n=1 Tax=Actinoplanes oblitus TaxID=3040509 RepID=A0ABY8WRP0_9ACTN|nr:MFS transporter [Actinoplanes oblitus]WIN00133.1 MFS transporter [Actinoplanes oblitus]